MKQLFIVSLLLVCVFGCKPHSSDISKEEAHSIMNDIRQRNLAYIPLTERDDTLMRQVVTYYKKHGTS